MHKQKPISRRTMLQGGAALAASALATSSAHAEEPTLKGNIQHSIVWWCFHNNGEKWNAETCIRNAAKLGCKSVELIGPEHWPLLKKHGLTCAIANSGYNKTGFKFGLNNPRHSGDVVAATSNTIEKCADAKVPAVIAFVGYEWIDPLDPNSGSISRDDAAKNCIKELKRLAVVAEKAKVNVCIEHLNSRDTTDPMKGHPGYQGDDLDFVCDILRKVGSPRIKLLYDIYHVQIMHGDLIRRLVAVKDVLGHVHTAGNPGRGELDDTQEIFYPAVMRKLLEIDYQGYVGHEFIPTRDPYKGLQEAIRVCDV